MEATHETLNYCYFQYTISHPPSIANVRHQIRESPEQDIDWTVVVVIGLGPIQLTFSIC
jgi:hypothetical protein